MSKREWEETMAASGQKVASQVKSKRASTRTAVLSKAFQVVDDDTKRQFQSERLEALERDNHGAEAGKDGDDDDEFKDDSEEEERPRKRGRKSGGKKGKRAGAGAGGAGAGAGARRQRRVKPLALLVVEAGLDRDTQGKVNYVTAAAAPSRLPRRHFCGECSSVAPYKCTRCATRYCCSACLSQHRETKCMKFGTGL